MKAAVIYAPGDMRLEEIPIPDVPAGSIRVKVKTCAICGTDVRIFRKGDYRARYPVVPGHEIAGIVDAVASGVPGIREGDRVCVAPGHGCGTCRMCTKGFPNVCLNPCPSLGYRVNGGHEEYMAVPENILRLGFVNPIPENLTYQQASMSEIVACCIHAQENTPVCDGDVVLVIGAGPAGIIHSLLAGLNGARKVLLTQRTKERLELARSRFPIHRFIVSQEENLQEAVMEETNGEGADAVFVCAPSPEAQETALRLVSPRGRVNFFGGLPKGDNVIRLDSNALHYREFFVGGASSSLPEGNRRALELLSERKIDPDRLITGVFSIDDVLQAFQVAENRRGIKVVVNF